MITYLSTLMGLYRHDFLSTITVRRAGRSTVLRSGWDVSRCNCVVHTCKPLWIQRSSFLNRYWGGTAAEIQVCKFSWMLWCIQQTQWFETREILLFPYFIYQKSQVQTVLCPPRGSRKGKFVCSSKFRSLLAFLELWYWLEHGSIWNLLFSSSQ